MATRPPTAYMDLHRRWLTERHADLVRRGLVGSGRLPHAVTAIDTHRDGLRLSVFTRTSRTRYVYVLPHARGWSIFASAKPDRAVYDWRHEPAPYKYKQSPVFAPRDKTGPWYVPVDEIVQATLWVVNELHPAPTKEYVDGNRTCPEPEPEPCNHPAV